MTSHPSIVVLNSVLKPGLTFNKFSADKHVYSTLVISVSTMIPFHCIYATPLKTWNPIKTFFDEKGNFVDFDEPCYSEGCQQLKTHLKLLKNIKEISVQTQKCILNADASQLIKTISQITSRHFNTEPLPLDFINKRVGNIAVESSFVGDVNIYTAAFTPHVI